MLNKVIILTSLLVLSFTALNAQGKDVEIIDFGEEERSANQREPSGFIIKTNPLSYLFGWQFIEVEKPLTDFLSVQGGFGLTFPSLSSNLNSEFQSEVLENYECESEVYIDDYCDDIYDNEIRDQKMGIVINGSIRLFFDDDASDGSYFGLLGRYSTKKYNVQDIVEGSSSLIRITDSFQKETERNIDLTGQYGYQILYDKLTTEYFVGLGARFSSQKRQDIGQVAGVYRASIEPLKLTNYRLELGARIGFQL